MEPINAKVILQWNNGRSVEIGTVEMTSEEKGTKLTTRARIATKRFGWEIVRLGFRVMFPHRRWTENHG